MSSTLKAPDRITRRNPAAAYPSPKALALDASLTRAQRIELLKRWQADLESRAEAVDEGMPPRPRGRPGRRRPDLRDVALALDLLDSDQERPTSDEKRMDVPYEVIPFAPSADPIDEGTPTMADQDSSRPRLRTASIVFWGAAIVAAALLGAPLLAGAAAVLLGAAAILTRLPFIED